MEEGEGTKEVREKGRRFVFKPKVCPFCADKSAIDYKDLQVAPLCF
jgi:ribosomal protein S18